jgi:hypothetical protein
MFCYMSGDPLTMGYFDNLESLNKYKRKLKNEKKNYRCVIILLDWWLFKFHTISLSFDSPSKTVNLKPLWIMKIWWSLMDYQMIMKLYGI